MWVPGAPFPPVWMYSLLFETLGPVGHCRSGNGLFVTLYHSLPKEELLVCFKSVLGEPVKWGEGTYIHPFYKSTGMHPGRWAKLEV